MWWVVCVCVCVGVCKHHVEERALHGVSADLLQRAWGQRLLEHEQERGHRERDDALERAEAAKEQCHDAADDAHCAGVW